MFCSSAASGILPVLPMDVMRPDASVWVDIVSKCSVQPILYYLALWGLSPYCVNDGAVQPNAECRATIATISDGASRNGSDRYISQWRCVGNGIKPPLDTLSRSSRVLLKTDVLNFSAILKRLPLTLTLWILFYKKHVTGLKLEHRSAQNALFTALSSKTRSSFVGQHPSTISPAAW